MFGGRRVRSRSQRRNRSTNVRRNRSRNGSRSLRRSRSRSRSQNRQRQRRTRRNRRRRGGSGVAPVGTDARKNQLMAALSTAPASAGESCEEEFKNGITTVDGGRSLTGDTLNCKDGKWEKA